MGTFKFYVYLCIFPTTICQVKDDSGGSIELIYEDTNHDDGTGKQPPISDGSGSKSTQDSTAEQSDDNSGKQPQMAGDIVNTFKKPFININQGRIGWPEENLIQKLMGISNVDMEEGSTPYKSSVRSFGFTTQFNTPKKFQPYGIWSIAL